MGNKLEKIKAVYKTKVGLDVDSEYHHADGIEWIVTRGSPPSVSALEHKLANVMKLYEAKSWDEVRSPADGIKWIVTRGAAPSICTLETRLEGLKGLYKARTGLDVDSESVHADGMEWIA